MKTKLSFISLLIFMISISKSFSQQEILYLDNVNPIFTITFPDNWKCERKGEAFQVISFDQAITVELWEDKKSSPEKTIQNLDIVVNKYITGLKVGVPIDKTKNNIKITEIKGRAKHNSKDIATTIYVFKLKNKNMVLLFFGAAEKMKASTVEITKIYRSIDKR